jgi:hypothetical protein
MKHIFLIPLLFSISLCAFEHHTENNRSSASQVDDQLNQYATEFQQALEKIASLEEENRELKEKQKKTFNFALKMIPAMIAAGAISAMIGKEAKKSLYQADSTFLEEIGKLITNPNLARGLAQKYPALYGNSKSFFNDTVTVHINPLNICWTLGTSLYNGYYHRMKKDEGYNAKTLAEANRRWIAATRTISSQEKNTIQDAITIREESLNEFILQNKLNHSEIVQLTACEILKRIVRSVHIVPKKDPIAPLPGTNITIITTDQLVSTVLKAGADGVERLVINNIQHNANGQHAQHFVQQCTHYAKIEIIYNLIAQTAHLITKNNDNLNPWVAILFPMHLDQPKTAEQSFTEDIIKWLLINGTPYVYQKLHSQVST